MLFIPLTCSKIIQNIYEYSDLSCLNSAVCFSWMPTTFTAECLLKTEKSSFMLYGCKWYILCARFKWERKRLLEWQGLITYISSNKQDSNTHCLYSALCKNVHAMFLSKAGSECAKQTTSNTPDKLILFFWANLISQFTAEYFMCNNRAWCTNVLCLWFLHVTQK